VAEQRASIEVSNRERGSLRAGVEEAKNRQIELQAEQERLTSGGSAVEVEAQRAKLEATLAELAEKHYEVSAELPYAASELAGARGSAEAASSSARQWEEELQVREQHRSEVEGWALVAGESAAIAEARLAGMISVEEVQRVEGESRRFREAIEAADVEARRLRSALADALSTVADLPNALQELAVLRRSAEGAAERMQALETVNAQLQGKVEKLAKEISSLRRGAVDLHDEEGLMREVIIQQSENLLRKVEDLTDERSTADADRKRLLEAAAELLERVDSGEARLARRADVDRECTTLAAAAQSLGAEVDRLRRTNGALCQQVLGEDGEGELAGALAYAGGSGDDVDEPSSASRRAAAADDEEVRLLQEEVCRLVRGRQMRKQPGGGSVRTDASALALTLQQALAEREESFWVERQRLSDRITALERARGGRTGALLRHYDTAARGEATGGSAAGGAVGAAGPAASLASATSAASSALTGGVRRLRSMVA